MDKNRLRGKIVRLIKGKKLASLATVVNGKPWVRFVVSHGKGLSLYICTYKGSRKIRQIIRNPNVHITIGGDMNNLNAPYVQITGVAAIRQDKKIRREYWHDYMLKYYTGPDDPRYAVIEVKLETIEYRDSEMRKPQVYALRQNCGG